MINDMELSPLLVEGDNFKNFTLDRPPFDYSGHPLASKIFA